MPTCSEIDADTGKGCQHFGRKSTACLVCENRKESYREDSHQGQTFVPFDTVPESEIERQPDCSDTDARRCLEFIRVILDIETLDREILLRRISGVSLRRIALRINREFKIKITLQAVHLRLKRLSKLHEMAGILLMEERGKG